MQLSIGPRAALKPGSVALIALLGILTALGPLATDMYLPGLGAIERDLHASAGQGSLTVAIFFLGMSAGQLIYGPLSDRKGRRAPLLLGIMLYLAGNIGCALAPSFALLMAARLVTAIGGCAGMVVARAIVRDHFDLQASARMFSRLVLVMGVSPILSPLFGGFLIAGGYGWRTIFWLLAGLGAVTLAAVMLLLGESRSKEAAAHAARENVFASFRAVLRERDVLGYVLTGAGNQSSLSVYVAASASVVIGVYGVPVYDFGWVFGVNGIGYIAASQINARLLRRHRPHAVLAIASRASLAIAAVLTLCVATGFGGLWGLLVPLFALMSSLGFNMPNAMACALEKDPARAGATSALIGSGQFAIGMLGATAASLAFNHTALPMVAAMLLLIALGNVAFAALVLR